MAPNVHLSIWAWLAWLSFLMSVRSRAQPPNGRSSLEAVISVSLSNLATGPLRRGVTLQEDSVEFTSH
jgi:hypothetical protein